MFTTLLSNRWIRISLWVALAVVLILAPLSLPEKTNQTITQIAVFAVAVLGLNIVMGYNGQINLGQIFFVGLGAYVAAWGVTQEWNIVLVFILSFLVPGIAGLIVSLAASRLKGLAIAMVTIMLPLVGVPLSKRLEEFTGGSQGIYAGFTTPPDWSGLARDQWQYYVVISITVVVFILGANFVRGKFGRALEIVRDNESVASSMGISPYRYKVLSFTVASMFGGVSGFLYLAAISYTSPETMSFVHSIGLIVAMVVGGAASIVGSLLGGAYYVLIPQITNAINPNLTAVFQGIILLLVLFLLPGGLVTLPAAIRRLVQKMKKSEMSETHSTQDSTKSVTKDSSLKK